MNNFQLEVLKAIESNSFIIDLSEQSEIEQKDLDFLLNKIKEKRSMSSNLCSDNSDLIVKLDTKQ